MADKKTIGITEQGAQAKALVMEQFGLLNGTTKIGDYTVIAQVEVPTDNEGNTAPQFVEVALTVKNTKGNKRTPGFDLAKAVSDYEDVLAERDAKAQEKAEKAAAKAAKDAERKAAKDALDAEKAAE